MKPVIYTKFFLIIIIITITLFIYLYRKINYFTNSLNQLNEKYMNTLPTNSHEKIVNDLDMLSLTQIPYYINKNNNGKRSREDFLSHLYVSPPNNFNNRSTRFKYNNEFCAICYQILTSFFPHLKGQSSLNPIYLSQHNYSAVKPFSKYAIGIPSAERISTNYLIETLRSILVGTSEKQLNLTTVYVLLTGRQKYIINQSQAINQRFGQYVRKGYLVLATTPLNFYPNWNVVKPSLGDSADRTRWRVKQILDFVYLMLWSYNKSQYYIQLEDDLAAKYNFMLYIEKTIQETRSEWCILDFCSLGFIGKLFHSSEIPKLTTFFALFHLSKPIDWLLGNYVEVMYCTPQLTRIDCAQIIKSKVLRFTPMFQHLGLESSLKGKKQDLKVSSFETELFLAPHKNPSATLSTTLKTYLSYDITRWYDRKLFFWSFEPKRGDTITVKFDSAQVLKHITIKSGHEDHYKDRLYDTALEIRFADDSLMSQTLKKLLHKYYYSNNLLNKNNDINNAFENNSIFPPLKLSNQQTPSSREYEFAENLKYFSLAQYLFVPSTHSDYSNNFNRSQKGTIDKQHNTTYYYLPSQDSINKNHLTSTLYTEPIINTIKCHRKSWLDIEPSLFYTCLSPEELYLASYESLQQNYIPIAMVNQNGIFDVNISDRLINLLGVMPHPILISSIRIRIYANSTLWVSISEIRIE